MSKVVGKYFRILPSNEMEAWTAAKMRPG